VLLRLLRQILKSNYSIFILFPQPGHNP
jgi:hypothetical protein